MKKIAVFGSNGMLGYAVTEYFANKGYEVRSITRNEFDIASDHHDKLLELLNDTDIVINCAGIIKPRIKDSTPVEVLRVNSVFPHNLAKVCNQKLIKCFHITTDCVYSGKKGSYNETDLFDADDFYGTSKNGGDSADCMVLRTSIIGEEKGQSRSLLEWARGQAGKEVNGFLNHDWNGVTTVYLAETIERILEGDLYEHGIFHIHSPNSVNKYELVSFFNEVYDLNMKINPVNAEKVIDRTMTSVKKLSSKVCTKSIREQVEEMRSFFSYLKKTNENKRVENV